VGTVFVLVFDQLLMQLIMMNKYKIFLRFLDKKADWLSQEHSRSSMACVILLS
jgi:hypothetical protein